MQKTKLVGAGTIIAAFVLILDGYRFATPTVAEELVTNEPGSLYEFTSKSGRKVKGRVLKVTGRDVTLQRATDDRVFTMPIDLFSTADQAFIRSHDKPVQVVSSTQQRRRTRSRQRDEPQQEANDAIWSRFRGTAGSATPTDANLPESWNDNNNIVWRTRLPGPGASSPIIYGSKIYLTSYIGYGLDQRDPGTKRNLQRVIYCCNLDDGAVAWQTEVRNERDTQNYQGFIALHGYASSTPACDGERIYAFFGSSGVYAFDLSGEQLWHTDVGSRTHGFGTGTSVVLFGDFVIVNACVESQSLIALDKETGREVWRARNIHDSWNTPIIVDAGNRPELVVDTKDRLLAFDPRNGNQLWFCDGSRPPRYVCPSPIVGDGIIYAIHGYNGPLSAIRPGGNGNVTNSHRQWTVSEVRSNVPSPVYHDGYIYGVRSEGGQFFCVNVKTGELVYRERLNPSPGKVYASPLAADGKVYVVSRDKGTYVVAAGPSFRIIEHNRFDGDRSIFNASPIAQSGRLYLRSDEYLYCIANGGG